MGPLPDLPVYVTPHAVDRFVERIGGARTDAPGKIEAALKALQAIRPAAGGNGWVVRTRPPTAIRVVLEPSDDSARLVVVTVLTGSRTKGRGNVAAQKARRAARKEAANAPA